MIWKDTAFKLLRKSKMQYSTNTRFQRALVLPLYQRCYELTVLIEECSVTSSKEIYVLFPLLLENVFGSGSYPGWELKALRRNVQPREFDLIRSFLAPDGVVMRLVYRLMNDAYLKYEFPVSCLPLPARRCIEDGILPPFYVNKIQSPSPGKLPAYLSLNPFEFYVFHFAHLLTTNSRNNNMMMVDWSLADSLYAHLADDYLQYFLPNDGGYPPAPPYASSPGKPLGPSPISNRNHQGSRLGLFGSTSLMSLIKQPVFTRQISAVGSPQLDSGHVEIWRTEVFVQTLTELWLNHFNVDTYRNVFYSPEKSHCRSPNWSLDSSVYSASSGFSFNESFFPTTDHMLLLRMLIKHLHFFSNSARANSSNPFDDFKRTVVHQVLQKKLYGFLRHMFDHWPLDASFKVVLELWLCYIQPWRYLNSNNNNRSSNNHRAEDRDRVQLAKWQLFVEENVVFYSQFFRKMIPRLLRVELGSSKHASMFYRLSKVFGQPNLEKLIRGAEDLLQEPILRLTPVGRSSSISPLSSPSRHGGVLSRSATDISHVSVVRQHVGDLLGTNAAYVPMFGAEATQQVTQLLLAATRAKDALLRLQPQALALPPTSPSRSWSLLSALGLGSDAQEQDGGATFTEMQRAQQYLDYGLAQTLQLFQISPDQIATMQAQSTRGGHSAASSFYAPCNDDSDLAGEVSFLSATSSINRSYQLLSKQSKPDASFHGNPDLEPIMSYEIAPLVRMFYRFSNQINKRYGPEIQQLYERQDFVGRLSRQFIQPPRMTRSFAHYGTPSPLCETYLPPRTSLRGLATQHAVGTVLCYFGVAYVFNFGAVRSLFIGFLFLALWACGVALFQPYLQKMSTPTRSQRRTSGSDSQLEFLPVPSPDFQTPASFH